MVAVLREHRDGAQPGAVWRRAPAKKRARLLGRLIEAGQNGIRIRPLGGNRAGKVGFGRLLRNPRVIPTAEIVDSSNDFGGLYRARGCPGESACGPAPNQDAYQRPVTGRTVSN
jgi:hypothetical protein